MCQLIPFHAVVVSSLSFSLDLGDVVYLAVFTHSKLPSHAMTSELQTTVGQTASIDVLTSDIKTLEALLRNGQITSRCLVEAYLAQIAKHDDYLHAMIQITPRELLFERADSLDEGRKAGQKGGPLYGIPIIVKVCSESGIISFSESFLLIALGYTGYPSMPRAGNHSRQLVTGGIQASEKQQSC